MVHPKIGAVRAQLFGGNRQIDGLQQRVGHAERVADCADGVQWPNDKNQSFS
jgi:hypothetical protein